MKRLLTVLLFAMAFFSCQRTILTPSNTQYIETDVGVLNSTVCPLPVGPPCTVEPTYNSTKTTTVTIRGSSTHSFSIGLNEWSKNGTEVSASYSDALSPSGANQHFTYKGHIVGESLIIGTYTVDSYGPMSYGGYFHDHEEGNFTLTKK